MTLKRGIALVCIVLLIACGLLIFALQRVHSIKTQIDVMQAARQHSLILAAELEESSKNLTSAVRSFAVTGDENFASAYMDVVDIRSGNKPRPATRSIAPGKKVSLTQLMREAGFTDGEFALLQQANDLSNSLIMLETEAMNAVRGLFPNAQGLFTVKGEPDKARAMSLVFSPAYNEEVAKIMEPLSRFTSELNQRLDGRVATAQKDFDGAMVLLAVTGAVLLIMLMGFLLMVYVLIIRPILKCDIFAQAVARGDLSTSLDYKAKNEIGMLAASLRAIPATLKGVIEEYRRLEKELLQGNLAATGDASRFTGEFADLIKGTNAMLARYQLIFDMINAPIGMFDKNMRLAYMNAFAKKFGDGNSLGKSCREILAREDDGTSACAMRRAAETLKTATAETRAHPGGGDMDISYTVVPFIDEHGKLISMLELVTDLTEIKKTQHAILEAANQAQGISNQVATASEEISSLVAGASRGTEIQRERIGSTAISMEEMNSAVLKVAGNASQASEQAESTRDKASKGAELVDNVIGAIKEVHAVASELNENMQTLGLQADSIGSVMGVISDIADQTNLLALNAAIEAARAGDAGRGFAVVADEVRKLAEKTMSATTEVGSNINAIQTSTLANIQRVSDAAQAVNRATELASVSGEALKEIQELVNTNSCLIASIATAAEQQSATSEEINRAIADINGVVEETSNGMQQSAEAVRRLSAMAQELRELLDRLRS